MPQKTASKSLWCVYNHLPGGHLVATHFETYTRLRKVAEDKTEPVEFTAEAQLEAFKRSGFVGLKMKGKDLVKNQILAYPANAALPRDPANAVLDWAIKEGAEPHRTANELAHAARGGAAVADPKQQAEIDQLKTDISDLKKSNEETKAGIAQILEALNSPKKRVVEPAN